MATHEAIIGGLFSAFGARRQQSFDAKQAQKQMDFQERMSSTAHQREVLDLRAAGLNPILSGTGGAGASSPAGARSTGQNIAGAGVASALNLRRVAAEIKQIDSATDVNLARRNLVVNQADALEPVAAFGQTVGEGVRKWFSGGSLMRFVKDMFNTDRVRVPSSGRGPVGLRQPDGSVFWGERPKR